MANRAYISIWCKDFSEAKMLGSLEQLLKTVPFSSSSPGFTWFVIRALGPEQAPLVERDLRARPLDAESVAALVGEHLHADCACEVQAYWDLWVCEAHQPGWRLTPQRLAILCYGEDYDLAVYEEAGHFQLDLGFEHLFTGHAGLLGCHSQPATAPGHPVEADFLNRMTSPERHREYQEKTRENIRRLLDWMQGIESALPVERCCLWSEGEENFEARLDEILAGR